MLVIRKVKSLKTAKLTLEYRFTPISDNLLVNIRQLDNKYYLCLRHLRVGRNDVTNIWLNIAKTDLKRDKTSSFYFVFSKARSLLLKSKIIFVFHFEFQTTNWSNWTLFNFKNLLIPLMFFKHMSVVKSNRKKMNHIQINLGFYF